MTSPPEGENKVNEKRKKKKEKKKKEKREKKKEKRKRKTKKKEKRKSGLYVHARRPEHRVLGTGSRENETV